MRIENISLKFNLVSSSSCGHQKITKKLKEREKKKKNWRITICVAIRSWGERKKWRKRDRSRRKLKPLDFNDLSFLFYFLFIPKFL